MTEVKVTHVTDKTQWEEFNSANPPTSLLQSWAWGQFQMSLGRPTIYLGIYEDGKLVGTALCNLIPTRFRTHVYIGNGPTIDWSKARALIPPIIKSIRESQISRGALFVRMDPLIVDDADNHMLMKSLGFRTAATNVQAEDKWLLDITPPEDELLRNMRKNTRYAIRKAGKESVVVRHSRDVEDFDRFWDLFQNTVNKQKFVPHSRSYYRKQIMSFNKHGCEYRIYWAEYQGKTLAAALIPFCQDFAIYLHATSSDEYKNVFPAHALIWQIILDAKQADLKVFDFWGVAPNDNPNHPWAGFTFFKTGFGGSRHSVIRAQDLPLSPAYPLVRLLEGTRRTWGKAYFNICAKIKT